MAQKRANGEGSIRKRSDGRWEARYVSPKDGRQHSLYAKTQKEVRQKLTQVMSEIDGGSYVDPTHMTVAQWMDLWLHDYCRDLKPTTLQYYRRNAEGHIAPKIGSLALTKLSKIHVQHFVNSLEDEGLAAASINTIRMVLSSAMQTAVEMGIAKSNPCAGIRVKRQMAEKMNIVDRQMFAAFVEAANKTLHGDALIFTIMTGLRVGEMRGLRWEDIDFSTGKITVARQLAYANRQYMMQSPKSGKERVFVLPVAAIDLLKKHRIAQHEDRMRCGENWIDDPLSHDLVFRRPDGGHYRVNTINHAVKMAGEAVGIDNMSPHDLRHSFAVAALRSGMDVKSVQHMLGHASASMTLDIYAHYTEDMGRAAAERIDAYWQDAMQ